MININVLYNSFKIHKTKTYKAERRNQQIYNYSGRFNTSFLVIDITSRQKMRKDREDLNNTEN